MAVDRRIGFNVVMGPVVKAFRVKEKAWNRYRLRVMGTIGRELKAHMKWEIQQGVSGASKTEPHLAKSIKIEKVDDHTIRVYPTLSYARTVDQGMRPGTGRYVPYLAPGGKYDIKEVKKAKAKQKVGPVSSGIGGHGKGLSGMRGRASAKAKAIMKAKGKAYWQSSGDYGKGKRLIRAKNVGVHPGYKGINFTVKTWNWAHRELRKIIIDDMRRLGVWG